MEVLLDNNPTGQTAGTANRMTLTTVLDRMTAWIDRYSVHLSEHEARVMALWAAHTWVVMGFYTTPRLIFSSATKGSGKTRQLELLENLTCSPKLTADTTPAVLFRTIEKGHEQGRPPTILFDEADATFNEFGGGKQDQLRGLANSGYKQGGTAERCVGNDNEVKTFHTFAPVAFAGIAGNMPDTIVSRAITLEMRKRKRGEPVAPYNTRRARRETEDIRAWLELWSGDAAVTDYLEEVETQLPPGVEDRAGEVWEPLITIADLADEPWGQWAREACVYFLGRPSLEEKPRPIRLLEDIRTVMEGRESIPTADLCTLLNGLESAEWGSVPGGIQPYDLSRTLRPFGVAPVRIRDGRRTYKGYTLFPTHQKGSEQVGLQDAWDRHLPPTLESGNSGNIGNIAGQSVADTGTVGEKREQWEQAPTLRAVPDVPPSCREQVTDSRAVTSSVPDVPDVPTPSDTEALETLNAMIPGDATPVTVIAEQRGEAPEVILQHLHALERDGRVTTPNGKLYTRTTAPA